MKINILKYCALCLIITALACMSSCSNDDDNGSGAVVLEAFGPSPALRGSELTFIGKNLDKVTSVILPEGIEVTDIEVVSKEKIKITIPQDAKEGYVKLVASGTEVTTKTLLTYTEPISITKFAPSPVKAGQTLTIEGDYLNLIQKVVFSDNVEVSYKDFLTWERKKIEVVVPREAQTGIIILADTAAIPVELKSETELQVVLPSVEKVLDLTNKKPGDVVSTIGKNLDLVESVQLPDGAPVAHAIKDDVLAFTLPEGITDGAIVMVAYSGVHVAIANIGVAVPTDLVATPATGIKDGSVISIKGVNMDLVTTALFPGVSEAVTLTSKSATEIKVTTPTNAKTGDLILNTASGKTVSVKITTLKPEILSYNPSSVAAGNEFTIKGKNLDLVTSVTFGGNKVVEVTPTSSTDLVVKAPVDAETGELTLTMKNGETVKGSVLTVTKPDFCYIPVLPENEIKAGTILAIDIKNADKLTSVQIDGSNVQYILQGDILNVPIPSTANGNTPLKLVSSNGEITYTLTVKGVGPVITSVWSGSKDIANWAYVQMQSSLFSSVQVGDIIKVTVDASSITSSSQGSFKTGATDWPAIADGTEYFTITGDYTLTVTENIKQALQSTGLIISGKEYVAKDVSILHY
ncbi:conserved exported hypothetical protein [uncultured Dysgonomonas sp.]|uniref:IPT/TIG domain-containing protein n=1 Tax=uncultured Dysgonomonas sp. TaxID=206096 RepID=A0A212KAT1_9BACT|nr:IPT/TIG domain-containing protein [uncultured Dysgonomonas sp.]SBW08790.1 conserved exported hypothetical protein [uncultured Dysgonomonas sp.]